MTSPSSWRNLRFCLLVLSVGAMAAHADRVDDAVRAEMARQKIPGASIAIVRNGKLVKSAGYGLANVELNVKATPKTVYQIQSMTKSFTATGVLMLVDEGTVGLDDPVSKYLDGTPEAWKDITIRRLLTHTSGIKDYINEPTQSLRLEVSDDEVMKAAAPRPLNFTPGDRYAYSNTNYLLLGMVIRRVTGAFYGDFLNERIFEPLGMKDTRVVSLNAIIPNRASGYMHDAIGLRNGEYVAASVLGYPGGGLRSTVLDLAKWDIALTEGRILKPETRQQMWSKTKLNDGSESGYGFGWGVAAVNGHRLLTHAGGHMTGFTSVIERYPDDGISVIILSNLGGADVSRIAREVAGIYVKELAPKTEPAIADKNPDVTALLKKLIAEFGEGKSNMDRFTPEMRAALTPETLGVVKASLAAAGTIKSYELLQRSEAGGLTTYRYRVRAEKDVQVVTLALNAEGKIAGAWIAPE